MRKAFISLLVSCLIITLSAAPAKPVDGFLIKITQDKAKAVYEISEKINFHLAVYKDGKIFPGQEMSYLLYRDGQDHTRQMLTSSKQPLNFSYSLKQPGFVLAVAEFKTKSGKMVRGLCGAAVEPLKIKPAAQADEAFKEFWDAKVKMLKVLPLNVKATASPLPARWRGKLACYDIKVECPSGMPVSGYLVKPVNAKPKSLPAFVSFHGAGVTSARKQFDIASWGALALDINAHGIVNGKDKKFYNDLYKGKLKGYPFFNRDNKYKCYFLGMFMRVYRSLQYIKSQPEWDGKSLIISGSSQGGAQAIVAAALDPAVTFCVARVPAMCDHYGVFAKRQGGWPHFIKLYKSGKAANPAIADCARYYDVSLLAPRIKARMLMTAGFIDTTCAPSTVYAAYNSITSPKRMINNVKFGHYNPSAVTKQIIKELKNEIQKNK